MNLQDSLNILGISGSDLTLDEVKTAYRRAAIKYHPDRNAGGLEMMKAVNAAWDYLQTLDWNRPVSSAENAKSGYGDDLMAFINAVIDLEGISLEVCGSWVWVSGNTKPHKDAIKAAGGRWASKKKQWYFRPEAHATRRSRGEWDMAKIRETFGTAEVKKPNRPKLES